MIKYKLVQCLNCDLVYIKNIPDNDYLRYFYDEVLNSQKWLSQFPEECNAHYYQQRNQQGAKGYEGYANKIKEHKQEGKILDIGCGDACMLRHFFSLDKWQKYGCDISNKAYDFHQGKNNFIFFHGYLEEAKYPSDTFDVVTGFDVIEHVIDPMNLVKEIHRILKPKGLLVLHTVNIKSREFKNHGVGWHQITPPGHLVYFSPKTIKKLLSKVGFNKIKIDLRMELFSCSQNERQDAQIQKSRTKVLVEKGGKQSFLKQYVKLLIRPLYNSLCQIKGKFIGKHDMTIYAVK